MGVPEMRRQIKKYIDEADDKVVRKVYSMLNAEMRNNWWTELPREVQQSVIVAEKELLKGKGIPHKVVMEKYLK